MDMKVQNITFKPQNGISFSSENANRAVYGKNPRSNYQKYDYIIVPSIIAATGLVSLYLCRGKRSDYGFVEKIKNKFRTFKI